MTPGADLSNSLSLITDYVPGAWVTHDQLHVRGGHQVTWAIDGVPIPNTNIASNVGPQIDPKDIDYLEAQRGGYSSAYGDRTYGVFNVVPRTGFEREQRGGAGHHLWHVPSDQRSVELRQPHREVRLLRQRQWQPQRLRPGNARPRRAARPCLGSRRHGDADLQPRRQQSIPVRDLAPARRLSDSQRPDAAAAGVRDVERERDVVANFSWAHTFRPGVLLTVSPFYHYNRANYDGDPNDTPVSTTQHRASQYAGAQVALTAVTSRHNARIGVYGFGQHDDESVNLIANDGSGDSLAQDKVSTGHLEAVFLEDQFKAFSWLTLTAGVRLTHFSGAISENAASPRLGGAIRIPQAELGAARVLGPVLPGAAALHRERVRCSITPYRKGSGFIPLRGERDQEHQFGLTIPLRGWALEVNNYHQRARNYFDHNAIGNSNVFFPLTIDEARLYGWEVGVRSPQLFHRGEVYLAYAYAHAWDRAPSAAA